MSRSDTKVHYKYTSRAQHCLRCCRYQGNHPNFIRLDRVTWPPCVTMEAWGSHRACRVFPTDRGNLHFLGIGLLLTRSHSVHMKSVAQQVPEVLGDTEEDRPVNFLVEW